ncbi:MAG: hypothetical protein MI743_18645, partial [Sneathiellales bacterium]|nr:hypothetical protein [Sneathiellales bacterium]
MKRFIIPLLLWFFSSCAYAQVALSTELESLGISEKADYLIDSKEQVSIEQLLDPAKNAKMEWFNVNSKAPNFGFTQAAYWARIQFVNQSNNTNFVIQLEYPLMDQVDFYIANQGELERFHQGGDSFIFANRILEDRLFSYPITVPENESRTVYFKVRSTDTVIMPFRVYTREAYEHHVKSENFIFGGYYGAILIILIYNSFLFFVLRDKSQLYYVLLIGSYATMELSLNGVGSIYFWDESPEIAKRIRPFMLGVLTITMLWLTKALLDIKRLEFKGIGIEAPLWLIAIVA